MEEFIDMIITNTQGRLEKGYSLKKVATTKNNNQRYYGIMLSQEGNCASPVYYINGLYSDFEDGRVTLKECVERFIDIIENPIETPIDHEMYRSYDLVKDEIMVMLVNYEANMEQLKERPHLRFLDLAAVFYLNLHIDADTRGVLHITDDILSWWKVDKDEFISKSLQHYLKSENALVMDMQDMLVQMICGHADKDVMQEFVNEAMLLKGHLYVITNAERKYGAGMLLHQSMLHNLAESHNDNLIIYPSSIHELIIAFETDPISRCLTKEDVESINGTNVLPEERLSNSVYRYDRNTREVSILEQGKELTRLA